MKRLIVLLSLICVLQGLYAQTDRISRKTNTTSTQSAGKKKVAKKVSTPFVPVKENIPEISMVFVKGGNFMMGATPGCTKNLDIEDYEDELPVHQVQLDDYYISKFEVTQKLWKSVMGNNPSNHIGDNLPVEWVSWLDAKTFIKRLNEVTGENYRLPTEAEWEYAARGGMHSTDKKYSGSDDLVDYGWYNNALINRSLTQPVGSKKPNELGLYDMSGNVMEWCEDIYSPYRPDNVRNPLIKEGKGRVLRGGHKSGMDIYCRVSSRCWRPDDHLQDYMGFRLAKSVK